MSLQLKPLPKPSPAHSQSNSLLLQFILYEFITAYYDSKHLKEVSERIKKQQTSHDVSNLLILVNKLVSGENGVLTKLKSYCTLFLKNAKHPKQELVDLHEAVKKVWMQSFLILDLLQTLNHFPPKSSDLTVEALMNILQQIDKFHRQMKRIAKLIELNVADSRNDENVLLFLVRYHKHFAEIYRSNFIGKLINKMYSKGIIDAEHLLLKKYKERGFDYLLPFISNKIAEID